MEGWVDLEMEGENDCEKRRMYQCEVKQSIQSHRMIPYVR